MKINQLFNLWVAYNATEDFQVLVIADCEVEALEVAKGYFEDANMLTDEIQITEFEDVNTRFDCDYAIYRGQEY